MQESLWASRSLVSPHTRDGVPYHRHRFRLLPVWQTPTSTMLNFPCTAMRDSARRAPATERPIVGAMGYALDARRTAVRIRWQFAQTTSHLSISASTSLHGRPFAMSVATPAILMPRTWSHSRPRGHSAQPQSAHPRSSLIASLRSWASSRRLHDGGSLSALRHAHGRCCWVTCR